MVQRSVYAVLCGRLGIGKTTLFPLILADLCEFENGSIPVEHLRPTRTCILLYTYICDHHYYHKICVRCFKWLLFPANTNGKTHFCRTERL